MLTKSQVESLPKGMHHNSSLRKKFGPSHGTPVKFQDEKGKIHVFVSNRWWARFRKRNPIIPAKAKKQNIESEFRKVFGKQTKININWFAKFMNSIKDWFKAL